MLPRLAPTARRALSARVPAARTLSTTSRLFNAPPLPRGDAEQKQYNEYQAAMESAKKRWWMNQGLILAGVLGFAYTGYLVGRNMPTKVQMEGLLPTAEGLAFQEATPPQYGSIADYRECIGEIAALFGSRAKGDRVSTDEDDLRTHGISDWSYHEAELPTVVVWVETTEEVQEIVRISNKWRVPITPFSGGTSLEGHFASPFGGISLDVSLMDKIISISEADGEAVCQPGVKWEDLNAHLAKQGVPLFFPIDPGPGATLGGMAGTGCSGTNAVRYGTAKGEWFLNLVSAMPACRQVAWCHSSLANARPSSSPPVT